MIGIHQNTANILKNIKKGDQCAFRSFFDIYYPKLLHFCHTLIRNKSFAEEIVQDVFSAIWKNRKRVDKIRNIDSYLYTATRHRTIDFLRAWKDDLANIPIENLEHDHFISNSDPQEEFLAKELFEILNEEVLNLPEKAQLVYRMIKEEGLTYQQVSELLNISTKTVDNHLCSSIRKIREAVNKYLSKDRDSGHLRIVK